jgi:hypothetical protein
MTWREVFAQDLPVLGHRNWILVTDSAYPSYASPAMRSHYTGEPLVDVLSHVLARVKRSGQVRPVAVLDAELAHLSEDLCPGVEDLRLRMAKILGGLETHHLPHEEVMAQIAEAGASYQILSLKAHSEIPYSSVFLRLECGYWSEDQERELRTRMGRS